MERTGEPGSTGSRYVAPIHGGPAQHGEVLAAEPPARLVIRTSTRTRKGRVSVEVEVHHRFVAAGGGTEVHSRRVVRCSHMVGLFARLQAKAAEHQREWAVDRISDEIARAGAGVTVR